MVMAGSLASVGFDRRGTPWGSRHKRDCAQVKLCCELTKTWEWSVVWHLMGSVHDAPHGNLATEVLRMSCRELEEEFEAPSSMWPAAPDLRNKLILIKHAAAGVGPECRSRCALPFALVQLAIAACLSYVRAIHQSTFRVLFVPVVCTVNLNFRLS